MLALLIVPALLVGYLYGRRTSSGPATVSINVNLVEHVGQPWPKDDVNQEVAL